MVRLEFQETETPQVSRELAEMRASGSYLPPFEVIKRRVIDDYHEGVMTIDATVVIRIGNHEETEAAQGVGVVHSLELALRKALIKYFPFLDSVRVIETYTHASGDSSEAEVVSVKKFADHERTWSTLAKSQNSVEAGWRALLDGYEWRIYQEMRRQAGVARDPRLSRR